MSSRPRRTKRSTRRLAIHWILAAMLVLLNLASLPVVQPFANLGPQEALAAPCPVPIGLINGGFEEPVVTAASGVEYFPATSVPGWLTTDSTNTIEMWRAGDNPLAFPAYEGNQFAEINYLEDSQLHQDLDTSTLGGQTIEWSFAHHGRNGDDTMGLYIGAPGAEVEIQQFTTGNADWTFYSGTYTVPDGQNTTRFAYRAIDTAGGEPSAGNFIDAVSFGTPGCETDLAVEKTAATYIPGGPIEFTIEVTNTGAAPGEFDIVGATLTDTVPAEITDVEWTCAATPGSVCGEASGTGNDINTTFDILEGGTVTYTVTGTSPDTAPLPTISNTATVSAPDSVVDLDPSNDSSTVNVDPAAVSSDLSITKLDDPDPVQVNGELTYTLQVSNAGPDDAADATVVDTLPADAAFVSVDGGADWTCGYDTIAHEVECSANAPIVAGVDPSAITITVTAPATATTLDNQGVVSSTTDTNNANNSADASTTVEDLDWEPFICDGTGYIFQNTAAGGQLYRVETGQLPYTFAEIGDTGSYNVNAIGYHPTENVLYGWARDADSNVIGVVRIDATGEITELGMPTGVDPIVFAAGAISNDGSTYYARGGDLPGDQIYVINLATMSGTLVTLDQSAGTGDIAENPLEPGVLYGTVSGGDLIRISVDAETIVRIPINGLDPADLPNAGSASTWFTASGDLIAYSNAGILFQIDVDAPGGPTVVAREDGPPATTSDGASCATRVPSADLSVTKEADADTVTAGGDLTYTLQVFNAGPDGAADATVVDTLAADATFTSVDGGDDWTCAYDDVAHDVSCTANGAVGLGNADPITITINVAATATGDLVNSATVDSSTGDPDDSDNEDDTTTTVEELDWEPFICDGSGYIIQDPTPGSGSGEAQLYRVNTGQLPYTFEEIGGFTDFFINAIGYHPTQNVLYGWAANSSDDIIGLVRIDATGEVVQLGVPAGVNEDNYHVGTISNDGSTYYLNGGQNGSGVIYAIDLGTMTSTLITLDQNVNINDFAEHPTEPGVLYHVVNSSGDLIRITLATGAVETINVPGLEAGQYGAGWFTADGDLVAYENGGTVYQIDLEDPQNPQIVATVQNAPSSGNNDGAACAAREPSADLQMTKTVDPSVVGVGEQLTYTLQVFNAGPDTAEDVVVTDTLPAGIASVDSVTGDGWICTTTMTLVECTRDSLGLGNAPPITIVVTTGDAGGELVNSATVDSSTEDPDEGNNEDDTTTTNSSPGIVVDKVAEQITEIQVGDRIEYFYYVTNIGNVELTNISLEDDLIGPISCAMSSLPVGGTMTCVGEYIVTQSDFDNGEIVNVATVTGEDPSGDEVEDTDEERVPNRQQPGIDIDKFAEAVDDLVVGDVITYYYVVTNTGNVTLTDISVTDDLIPTVICPATVLGPGQSTTCTAEYTVTQADVDSGAVINVATATGDPPGDEDPPTDEDEEQVPNDPQPRIVIDKVAEVVTDLVVGDVIDYEYIVTNVGDVTLTNISVDDNLIPDVTCPVTELAPNESVTCTGSYTVNQADVDSGEIVNVAVVSGDDPDGDPVEDDDTERVPPPVQIADIEIDKEVEQIDELAVGDEITYTFVVTNTGNVTLTNVEVSDEMIPDLDCTIADLAPGETLECSATYTVTQADVDSGEIVNVATVTGDPPGDLVPPTDEDEEIVPPPPAQNADIEIDKIAEQVDELVVGDEITYTFVVTNTGDVTLTDVEVSDPLIPDLDCTIAELAPGQTLQCSATYTVTQADVNNGEIVNVATVTGDPEGEDPPIEEEDEEIVPNEPQPAIRILKSADHNGSLDEGDVIEYAFLVTNTGNVTLTDISVDDPKISNVSCPTDELAPGESMTCTGSYTVTRAEAIQGEVVNHATATGEDPDGSRVGDDDEETVTDEDPGPGPGPGPDPEAGIEVDKIAEQVDDLVVGDAIDYAFIVTNTGDVTLTDISIDDPLIPNVTCPLTELDPGEMMSCSGSYTVTEADVANGEVVNHATVTGETPDGDEVDDDDEETVTDGDDPGPDPDPDPDPDPEAGIDIDKVAEPVSSLVVGDVIDYQFIVTNTGDVTLTDVSVDDPLIPDVTCPKTELEPGETMTCTGSYTVTEADVENGQVVNHATVSGDPEGEDPPIEEEDEEIVPNEDPEDPSDLETGIAIDKVAEHTETLVVGDVIDYHFIITNTGDVTISDISVDDPLIPDVSCPQTELAAGESMICAGSYTVTEADVEAGEVVNNATVSGQDPDGNPIEEDDEEIVPNEPAPAITMDKVAEDVEELVVGDVITYQFIVTNSGNVTLTNVEVTDLLIPDVTCPATELAPGQSMTCTGDYAVTEADVDSGSIVNVASVTADPPGDLTPPEDTDTEIVPNDDDRGDDGDDGDESGDDDGDDDGSDDSDKGDDDDGKDDDEDDPSYPQLPPNTGLDVESAAGSDGSSAQILFMLTVFGMWVLAAGLALNSWQRRRTMP